MDYTKARLDGGYFKRLFAHYTSFRRKYSHVKRSQHRLAEKVAALNAENQDLSHELASGIDHIRKETEASYAAKFERDTVELRGKYRDAEIELEKIKGKNGVLEQTVTSLSNAMDIAHKVHVDLREAIVNQKNQYEDKVAKVEASVALYRGALDILSSRKETAYLIVNQEGMIVEQSEDALKILDMHRVRGQRAGDLMKLYEKSKTKIGPASVIIDPVKFRAGEKDAHVVFILRKTHLGL